MKSSSRLRIYGRLMAAVVVGAVSVLSQAQDNELKRLRADYAMRFLEPEPHMALAKYFLDRGDRLQAFYLLEALRRSHLEEKVFNRAFQLAFRGFDYGPDAERSLLKELAANPQSETVNFKLADLYIARDELQKAKPYLVAASKIQPDDFKYVVGLAEILRIEGHVQDGDQLTKDFLSKHSSSNPTPSVCSPAPLEKTFRSTPERRRMRGTVEQLLQRSFPLHRVCLHAGRLSLGRKPGRWISEI